jgi:acyl-CoA reductase-like NAD-dependent aldehyde dehydrogenase
MLELTDTRLHVAGGAHDDGPVLEVRDPWSQDLVASVTMADPARAEAAAGAAREAFLAMRALPSYARRDTLRKVAMGLLARRDELAEIIAREAGKPITYAKAEVARAVSTFDLASEEATRQKGEVMPLDVTVSGEGRRGEWLRVPSGPVLAISPFNFPLNLAAHKVAPALACGCSVLLKPPPQAPLASLVLAAIVREACPVPNALQVVPCDNAVAESLVTDDRFATLSFTGSAAVGWKLKALAGKKRVLLELGGNAAVLVHDDAPLHDVAERVVAAAFAYAGQVCIKVQRVYVQRQIAVPFIDDVVRLAGGLRVGTPLDPQTVLGPMIDEASARRVEAWVAEARSEGARVLVGGKRDGNRFAATVIDPNGPGTGLKVVDEEVFGPVLTLHVYDDWEEALAMADASRYGLQAGVFTDSLSRVQAAFERLHVGAVIANDVPTFRVDSMPYGGTRDSGLGREGVRFAIEEMTETKLLVTRAGTMSS